MDELQLLLSILIPLCVSVLVWTLTYIIPYIRPNWLSDSVLKVTLKDPKDPVGISLIINQFSAYDDWKRIVACKRMKRMFINKIREIEDDDEKEWCLLKNKVINMPLKDVLNKLNMLLSVLKDKPYEEEADLKFTSKKVLEDFEKKIESLEECQREYSKILENHPNAILWGKYVSSPKYIEKYNKKGYELTIKEIQLMISHYTVLDKDGKINKKSYLAMKGHEAPERQSYEEIISKFNELIFYIIYPHPKRDELTYRLVIGLSNHKKSSEILNELINEMETHIFSKDYKEWKTKFNLW